MSTNAKKSKAKNAFNSAKSSGEMIRALKVLESCSEESELCDEYLKLARTIYTTGGDLEEVLYYGKRALSIFIHSDNANLPCFCTSYARGGHGPPLFIGHILRLLGVACLKLKRYQESLSYLNWSLRNLNELETCPGHCVWMGLLASHLGLSALKLAMGRREEAASHSLKILEIKEKYMEEGCLEIGQACKDVYEAYLVVKRFGDALPFCLRASEIYSKHFGHDSVEVARIRRSLGMIYDLLYEHENALEQNQLAMKVFETVGNSSEFWEVKTESGNMLMHLGRSEEAVDVLKSVISSHDVDEPGRATAYITLATVFCNLKNFAQAHKYMKLGRKILGNKGVDPIFVACGLANVSTICKMMNDYETVIAVTRKVLALPELRQDILLRASDRLFELIDLSGKVRQGLPYMEDAVEKLKEKFGPEHYVVGEGHVKLAVALMESGRPESSVKHFMIAKDILDVSQAPNHLESPQTAQHVSCSYALLMGRYRQAIDNQKKVVEGPEGLGQSEEDILEEAIEQLNEMELRDMPTDPEK